MTCVVTLRLALGPLERHLKQATGNAQRELVAHHGIARRPRTNYSREQRHPVPDSVQVYHVLGRMSSCPILRRAGVDDECWDLQGRASAFGNLTKLSTDFPSKSPRTDRHRRAASNRCDFALTGTKDVVDE